MEAAHMQDLPTSADVVVVGAGFSGLTAARALEARGLSVCVVEARSRVGGRTMAGTVGGVPVDLGGQWLGTHQTLIMAEVDAQGLTLDRQYESGRFALHLLGEKKTFSEDEEGLSFAASRDLARARHRLDAMAMSLPDDAWRGDMAGTWDAQTLETWISRNMWTAAAAQYLRLFVRSAFSCETQQMSLLCFLDQLRAAGGFDIADGLEGGAQEFTVRGGMQQVAEGIARGLRGPVCFEAPVRAIRQGESSVDVTTDRGTVRGAQVIVALAPSLAARIDFANALPVMRTHLMQRMPMGTVIKLHLAYETPFWREHGFSGLGLSDDLACGVMVDRSPEDLSMGVLVGFIDADKAVEYSARGRDARRAAIVETAVAFFGEDAREPIDYAELDWVAEEWSLGCYVSHAGPGVLTSFGEALRQPCGRIHWAGSETATRGIGYIDGAMQSGLRAADEVAARLVG